jgi:phosphoribulokinase
MATTMTMSAACAQPLAARKSFGSKAKLGAPVKTRAARVNTVVRAARDGPVVIGLAADSGCGKSTFMRRMTSLFGGKASPPEGGNPDSNTLISDTTTVLCLDDYHLNDREGRKKSGLTALNLAEQDFGTSPSHF